MTMTMTTTITRHAHTFTSRKITLYCVGSQVSLLSPIPVSYNVTRPILAIWVHPKRLSAPLQITNPPASQKLHGPREISAKSQEELVSINFERHLGLMCRPRSQTSWAKSQVRHIVPLWHWEKLLTSLCLNFLTYKMGLKITPTHKIV